MKVVGDSIREGQTMEAETGYVHDVTSDKLARIQSVGVCLWGYVKDRLNLVIPSEPELTNRRPKTPHGQRHHEVELWSPHQIQSVRDKIAHSNLIQAYREPVHFDTFKKIRSLFES